MVTPRPNRKGPARSATSVEAYAVEVGSDGLFWQAIPSGASQRWVRVREGVWRVEMCYDFSGSIKDLDARDAELRRIMRATESSSELGYVSTSKSSSSSSSSSKKGGGRRCLTFSVPAAHFAKRGAAAVGAGFAVDAIVDESAQLRIGAGTGRVEKMHAKARLASEKARALKSAWAAVVSSTKKN